MRCESDKGWCQHSRACVGPAQVRLAASGLGMAVQVTDTQTCRVRGPALCQREGEEDTGRFPKGQVCAPPLLLWGRLGLQTGPNHGHGLRDTMRTENPRTTTAMCSVPTP